MLASLPTSRPFVRLAAGLLALCALLAAPAYAQLEAQAVVLVATPQLRDPLFAQSVVLVTRHGRSRPFGVILNRPLAAEAAPLDGERAPSHIGGPVSPHEIVFLARARAPEAAARELLALDGGLLMGFGRRLLGLLGADIARSQDLRVFAGFSAWAAGQLEAEIARGDWRVLPYEAALILRPKVDGLWRELWTRSERIST